jgi:hypothetical protein
MAKVTITFEDMNEGVSVEVQSDPPFPEKTEENAMQLTDAQQMALSMTMMFDQEMQEENQNTQDSEETVKNKCCGGGKCQRPKQTET